MWLCACCINLICMDNACTMVICFNDIFQTFKDVLDCCYYLCIVWWTKKNYLLLNVHIFSSSSTKNHMCHTIDITTSVGEHGVSLWNYNLWKGSAHQWHMCWLMSSKYVFPMWRIYEYNWDYMKIILGLYIPIIKCN